MVVGIPDKPYVENPEFEPSIYDCAGTAETTGLLGVPLGTVFSSAPAGETVDTTTTDLVSDPSLVVVDPAAAPTSGSPDVTVATATLDTSGTAGPPVLFDPNSHTVADVNAYLKGVDETERARVLQAEADSEVPRKSLVDTAPVVVEAPVASVDAPAAPEVAPAAPEAAPVAVEAPVAPVVAPVTPEVAPVAAESAPTA